MAQFRPIEFVETPKSIRIFLQWPLFEISVPKCVGFVLSAKQKAVFALYQTLDRIGFDCLCKTKNCLQAKQKVVKAQKMSKSNSLTRPHQLKMFLQIAYSAFMPNFTDFIDFFYRFSGRRSQQEKKEKVFSKNKALRKVYSQF